MSKSYLAKVVYRWTTVVLGAALVAAGGAGCGQVAEKPAREPVTPAEKAPAAKQDSKKLAQPADPVGNIDDKALRGALKNTANWLMYGRTYDAHRFSPLDQINKKNVKRLIPVWTFQTGVLDGFECTPLIIDGIMYISTP